MFEDRRKMIEAALPKVFDGYVNRALGVLAHLYDFGEYSAVGWPDRVEKLLKEAGLVDITNKNWWSYTITLL